ncbi:hypothetical protein Tco_1003560 [Tanacetum coccineum]|uniref:Uncharacterized protein n=1 Tax=Tanacetum coccineum TaxID=301880 RepID=A0ABQ5FBB6_9ASTR
MPLRSNHLNNLRSIVCPPCSKSLREEYNVLKLLSTARQSPTAFSEFHTLLSDHDYMLKKTCTPIAAYGPQAFYGARPSNNNNRSNNKSNHGNRNKSRANSHVTPDLEAMDNSEAYYGDDALHVGNDNVSDDEEILNVLIEYENAGTLRQERIINSFDGDDLVFEFMIGFRKFTAYRDPFLPMNIISRKAYNTIIIEGLEGTRKNLVAIVKDVYVFVGSFTYITDFVVLEDIGEFIMSDMAEVLMGRRFRKITKLEYDVGYILNDQKLGSS